MLTRFSNFKHMAYLGTSEEYLGVIMLKKMYKTLMARTEY